MRKLIVYIEEDQFEAVRKVAYDNSATLSAIIRWCIQDYCLNNGVRINRSPRSDRLEEVEEILSSYMDLKPADHDEQDGGENDLGMF